MISGRSKILQRNSIPVLKSRNVLDVIVTRFKHKILTTLKKFIINLFSYESKRPEIIRTIT